MERTVLNNNKGVSLIEILVSLVLVSIIFTGLIKASLLVANQNVANLMRDEAVSIAENRISQARAMPFDSVISEGADVTIARDFRGTTGFEFVTRMTVSDIDAENKKVIVTVTWTRKGAAITHSITSVVRKI